MQKHNKVMKKASRVVAIKNSKIIEIEGNEHDYEILDEYMKLLEKLFLQEEEVC